MLKSTCLTYLASVFFAVPLGAHAAKPADAFAREHVNTLRLSAYITAHEVANLDLEEKPFGVVVDKLRALGITRVFIEIYRGGFVTPLDTLRDVRDAFRSADFETYAGIATVPGEDVGVAQEGALQWFNWQNEKTQRDLAEIVRNAAPLFDHFIIDDFLCTGDISEESKKAKGDRDWADYRRALMTRVAQDALVAPARKANPDIHTIIKFPQWYDLFQEFGYDLEHMPPLVDGVYIGTETRGSRTQRFGFVQPYEGFVNFRWISAIAGAKTGGAWFDHLDTVDHEFVEQAFQSVIAGANEIVMFHFGALMEGHPDHERLVEAFPTLVELAAAVDEHPVSGAVAYKPFHGRAHDDLYVMDYIGMLGVPLVPSPTFPSDAKVILLPTQAAADPEIHAKVSSWLRDGRSLVMTAGFLSRVFNNGPFLELAGLSAGPGTWGPQRAQRIGAGGVFQPVPQGLDIAHEIFPETDGAEVIVEAEVDGRATPFLTRHDANGGVIYVLNVHTFSDEDFRAADETLLAPRDLGLVYLPQRYASLLRNIFLEPLDLELDAPARVTFQPFGDRFMIHNYNDDPIIATLHRTASTTIEIPGRGYHIGTLP